MDLLAVIEKRLADIPEGDHTQGVKSVFGHIQSAFRHFVRGKEQDQDDAFTDVILRANQAFEGGIKEAYRVIAGKNPEKETINNIEVFLNDKNVLRPRVLSQFKIYRTEWRNPSTHNYMLNFDEDEALLAFVSVSAFTIVLIEQIAEILLTQKAASEAKQRLSLLTDSAFQKVPFLHQVMRVISELVKLIKDDNINAHNESHLIALLHGIILNSIKDVKIVAEQALLLENRAFRADLAVIKGQESVIIEVKILSEQTLSSHNRMKMRHDLEILDMAVRYTPNISGAILFIFDPQGDSFVQSTMAGKEKLHVLSPKYAAIGEIIN